MRKRSKVKNLNLLRKRAEIVGDRGISRRRSLRRKRRREKRDKNKSKKEKEDV